MKLTAKAEIPALPAPSFDKADMIHLGGVAVAAIKDRVARGINLAGQPAKPYSPFGPIYVPISGVGTFVPKGKEAAVKRTKSALAGREVFTAKDVAKLRKAGLLPKRGKGAKGGFPRISRTGKSMVFADYAQRKKALGKSGKRDLELSGRMLGALSVVRARASSVEIGFTRAAENDKAAWNQAREEWFGLAPQDQATVLEAAEAIFAAKLR